MPAGEHHRLLTEEPTQGTAALRVEHVRGSAPSDGRQDPQPVCGQAARFEGVRTALRDQPGDDRNRRRTVIRPAARASERVEGVRSSRIDAALGETLGDPHRSAEVPAALATLARHLPPRH